MCPTAICFPLDAGRSDVGDALELSPTAPCDDGADNDGDGWAGCRLAGGDPGRNGGPEFELVFLAPLLAWLAAKLPRIPMESSTTRNRYA